MSHLSSDNSSHRRRSLSFLASLPERAVRVGAASLGGAVYQLSEVLLPGWLRSTKLYRATVARMLRITVEMVGGVRDVMPAEGVSVQELAMRKAAGNALEFASIFAVGWSPLWLLAAASDVTGGTKVYLRTLAGELKRSGLLPDDAGVASFEELLTRVEQTSGVLADTIDVPPVSLDEIRTSWEKLRKNPSALPTPETQAAIYEGLREASSKEGHSLLEVSSLIAQSAVRAGIQLGNTYIFHYYRDALGAILTEGLPAYMQRVSAPYITTVGRHLNPRRSTYTERLLRWVRRKRGAKPL
ncbi:MAG: hypothetical protein AAB289_01765 [Chloroflexota bacterium]